MTSRPTLVSAAVAVAIFATHVLAQQLPSTPMPAVPQPNCAKPEFPGAFADSRRFDRFNKEYKAYAECIKKYVDETKALADAIIEAGNKAIKEYNAFNDELAERQAAVKK